MSKLTIRQIEAESDVQDFCCGVQSIDNSVKDAFFKHILLKKKVFKICHNEAVVGVYQLSFGYIDLMDTRTEYTDYDDGDEQFCVLWIDFLAIRKELQGRGIGRTILTRILDEARNLSIDWPLRVIMIKALPDKVDWYLRKGFKYIRDPERSEVEYGTIWMFYDLMPEENKKRIEEYCNAYFE